MNLKSADYVAWSEYVAGELEKFYAHTDGITYLFQNTPAADRYIARYAKRGITSEQAAFSGPWHVARKHVTTEFQQWVEEYEGTDRLTLSQWRDRARAERDDIAWSESAEFALGELETLKRLIAERDALILDAARKGATKTAIARAVGLSRQQVHVIVAAGEASVPDVAPFDEWSDVASVPVGAVETWDEEPW